jgi:hypothetical protein
VQELELFELDPCDPSDVNGQCDPFGVDGAGSSVRASNILVPFDIVQPVEGVVVFGIDGTAAQITHSAMDIVFTVDLGVFGTVTTDTTARIEGAVGTVVGNEIQWAAGTQDWIANGTIDCDLAVATLCTDNGFAVGENVLEEGCNVTQGEGPPPCATEITLPDFVFSGGGSSLDNTGEFNISEPEDDPLLVALEGTLLIPEPGTTLLLGPGLLLVLALDRRRARARR